MSTALGDAFRAALSRSVAGCLVVGVLLSAASALAAERTVPSQQVGSHKQAVESRFLETISAPEDFVPGEVIVTFLPQLLGTTVS